VVPIGCDEPATLSCVATVPNREGLLVVVSGPSAIV
jgi:hypothetical protein